MIKYDTLLENEIPSLLELYKQLNVANDISINKFDFIEKWQEIEKCNIKYFVAKENDTIIASCYICIIPQLTYLGKSIGYIENVIVDEKYRGKGIGKQIIENAINYAVNENCNKVLLQSGMDRKKAHKFYESIGFDGETKKAFVKRLNNG